MRPYTKRLANLRADFAAYSLYLNLIEGIVERKQNITGNATFDISTPNKLQLKTT